MTANAARSAVSSDVSNADLAALILRVTSGLLFLTHGAIKLFVFTPAGTVGFFQSLGLPGALAYLVIALELIGGVALILGYKTRIFALLLAAELLGTIVVVHWAAGFLFANPNGGWEYPAFWAAAMIALSLLGDGAYSIGKKLA